MAIVYLFFPLFKCCVIYTNDGKAEFSLFSDYFDMLKNIYYYYQC